MEGFRRYFEAMSYGYFGPLQEILGDGEPGRLSFGTAAEWAGQPMLYIPLRPKQGGGAWSQVLNSIRRKLSKQGITCVPDPNAFNGYRCKGGEYGKSYIMHTGEAHVTVAMHGMLMQNYHTICQKVGVPEGTELRDALMHARLANGTYLFETPHQGIECDVVPAGEPLFGVAKSYVGEPVMCMIPVKCSMYGPIRDALGLPPMPPSYHIHATVGYVYPANLQAQDGEQPVRSTAKSLQKGATPSRPATSVHNLSYQARNPDQTRYQAPQVQRVPETY